MKHITTCFSDELIKICQQSYQNEKWRKIIHDFIGTEFTPHVDIGPMTNGKLILFVDTPAWGYQLRMKIPALRDHLRTQHRYFQLKFIQIKTQPELKPQLD